MKFNSECVEGGRGEIGKLYNLSWELCCEGSKLFTSSAGFLGSDVPYLAGRLRRQANLFGSEVRQNLQTIVP